MTIYRKYTVSGKSHTFVPTHICISAIFHLEPPPPPTNQKSPSSRMQPIKKFPADPALHRPLIECIDSVEEPIKFNPQHPRYRCMCNRMHVRLATGLVTLFETLWITYQFAKILVCYIRNPPKYTEIFLPSFIISLFSSLAIGILISAVLCQKATRLIPYMVMNILTISALLACILVSIIKSAFGSSHPGLASMASSIVPSFEVIFYLDISEMTMDNQHKVMLLVITLSSIMVLMKSLFLKVTLAYYHFLKDLEASTAPSGLTAVFAIR